LNLLELLNRVGLKQHKALDEAHNTIKGITGLEVNDITASVDPNSGKIKEYKVSVKIAFGVER
jgi:flavin-binding protein dodecin